MVIRQGRQDNAADRLVGKLAHRRENLVSHLFVTGIDEHHSLITDLNCDISAGACNQVDVALNMERLNFHPGEVRVNEVARLSRRPYLSLLCRCQRSKTGSHEKRDHQQCGNPE